MQDNSQETALCPKYPTSSRSIKVWLQQIKTDHVRNNTHKMYWKTLLPQKIQTCPAHVKWLAHLPLSIRSMSGSFNHQGVVINIIKIP